MDEDMEKLMGFHDQKKEREPIDIDDLRKQVVENAKKILNRNPKPGYRWEGTGPDAYDCSGFTQTVFKNTGLEIPRTSEKQSKYTGKLNKNMNELEPGDLIFFDTTGKGTVSHVGIYIGNGEFIDSGGGGRNTKKAISGPRKGVRVTNLNSNTYWQKAFLGSASLENIAIKNKIPLKNKETEKNRDKKSYKRDFEPSENTLFNGKENKKEVQVTVTPRKNIAEIKSEMSAKMKETNNENTINKADNNKKTKVNTR